MFLLYRKYWFFFFPQSYLHSISAEGVTPKWPRDHWMYSLLLLFSLQKMESSDVQSFQLTVMTYHSEKYRIKIYFYSSMFNLFSSKLRKNKPRKSKPCPKELVAIQRSQVPGVYYIPSWHFFWSKRLLETSGDKRERAKFPSSWKKK